MSTLDAAARSILAASKEADHRSRYRRRPQRQLEIGQGLQRAFLDWSNRDRCRCALRASLPTAGLSVLATPRRRRKSHPDSFSRRRLVRCLRRRCATRNRAHSFLGVQGQAFRGGPIFGGRHARNARQSSSTAEARNRHSSDALNGIAERSRSITSCSGRGLRRKGHRATCGAARWYCAR